MSEATFPLHVRCSFSLNVRLMPLVIKVCQKNMVVGFANPTRNGPHIKQISEINAFTNVIKYEYGSFEKIFRMEGERLRDFGRNIVKIGTEGAVLEHFLGKMMLLTSLPPQIFRRHRVYPVGLKNIIFCS